MTKTDRMLLLEERAGKDVRAVLTEAYEAAGGSIERAAEWIGATYGVPVSFGIFSDWVASTGGRILKTLEFPVDEAAAAPAAAGVAA